jgi:predicted CopG family antitoxin
MKRKRKHRVFLMYDGDLKMEEVDKIVATLKHNNRIQYMTSTSALI